MQEIQGKRVRVFVVWEPVLPTDFFPPSSASMKRIADSRAAQFWDKGRLVSKAMGEHDGDSIVWDHIAIYPPGARWNWPAPKPLYAESPIIDVVEETRAALAKALGP